MRLGYHEGVGGFEAWPAQKQVIAAAVDELVATGIQVTTEVEWDSDWYSAVIRAAERLPADAVLKSSYPHSARERILNKTSDWTLIRECRCPVLLVKKSQQEDLRTVLAAIDLRAEKDSYKNLNQNIIDFSQRVLESSDA